MHENTTPPKEIHPATMAVLAFFEYGHLPPRLQEISARFYSLAHVVASELEGPEVTVCLRKLLEAKDCAVRASL
jgi:hypothetical protein